MNLAVFTYFTLYFEDEDQGQDVFFYISSSIVLLTFVGILLYHICTYTSLPTLLRKFKRPTRDETRRLVINEEEYGATHSEW